MTRHFLTDDLDHGDFSPIGDHLDGVGEVSEAENSNLLLSSQYPLKLSPRSEITCGAQLALVHPAARSGGAYGGCVSRSALSALRPGRFPNRLSISPHRQHFVLKGALLITTWFNNRRRPMRDFDLLGFGDSDPNAVLAAFPEICAVATTP